MPLRSELKILAQKISRTASIMDHLDDFVQSAAESAGYDNWKDAEATDEVVEEAEKYEAAVEMVLGGYLKENPLTGEGYGDPEEDLWELLNENAAHLILMTLRGEGVGIWDGSWDHFFADPSTEIPKMGAYLKQQLRNFADPTGGGSLNVAFDYAAWETAGLSWDRAVDIATEKAIDEENHRYIEFLEERGVTFSEYTDEDGNIDETTWEEDVKNLFDSLGQDEDADFWNLVEPDY